MAPTSALPAAPAIGYPVIVTVNGAVDAQGQASPGIFAQSTGRRRQWRDRAAATQISITVGSATNSAASVWGGSCFGDVAAAVYFANGSSVNFPQPADQLRHHRHARHHGRHRGLRRRLVLRGDELGLDHRQHPPRPREHHELRLGHDPPLFDRSTSAAGSFVNKGTLDLTSRPGRDTADRQLYRRGGQHDCVFGRLPEGDLRPSDGDRRRDRRQPPGLPVPTLVPTTVTDADGGRPRLLGDAMRRAAPVCTASLRPGGRRQHACR